METEKTSKQKVAKMQLNDTKPQQEVEKQKREVVVPWMRNVVFCTPEWFIAPDKDVVKALSGASHLDERQVRKIMNGNVDFKISSIRTVLLMALTSFTFSFLLSNHQALEGKSLTLGKWSVTSGKFPVKRLPPHCPIFSESSQELKMYQVKYSQQSTNLYK